VPPVCGPYPVTSFFHFSFIYPVPELRFFSPGFHCDVTYLISLPVCSQCSLIPSGNRLSHQDRIETITSLIPQSVIPTPLLPSLSSKMTISSPILLLLPSSVPVYHILLTDLSSFFLQAPLPLKESIGDFSSKLLLRPCLSVLKSFLLVGLLFPNSTVLRNIPLPLCRHRSFFRRETSILLCG